MVLAELGNEGRGPLTHRPARNSETSDDDDDDDDGDAGVCV